MTLLKKGPIFCRRLNYFLFNFFNYFTITSVLKGAYKLGVGTVLGAVKETYEEIFLDGFIEAVTERLVSLGGGNQEMVFWAQSLATSAREGIGGGGQVVNLDRFSYLGLTAGGNIDIRTMYGQQIIQSSLQGSYAMFNTEVYDKIQSIKGALSQISSNKLADVQASENLLRSKIFKGLAMVAVGAGTFLSGNMNLLSAYTTLKSFYEFGSDVKEAAQTMSEFFTVRNIMRKQNIKISTQNLITTKTIALIHISTSTNLFSGLLREAGYDSSQKDQLLNCKNLRLLNDKRVTYY